MDEHQLLRSALIGLLGGGGLYAGMRLANDIPKASQPPQKPQNELEVPLPQSRMKQGGWQDEMLAPTLTGVGGAAVGFGGAAAIYDHLKRKALEKQLAEQEKGYMHTLQQANSKLANVKDTPNVDMFLEGMLNKVAEGIGSLDGEGIFGAGKSLAEAGANSHVGGSLLTALALLSLGTGGATFGIAKKMDAQKQQAKSQSTFPDQVNIKPV